MSTTPPSSDSATTTPSEPQLLRFGLRQLLLFVAVASFLLALLVSTHGPWPLVIGLSVLIIAGHLLGAMLGTRLRDTSREVQQWRRGRSDLESDEPRTTAPPVQLDKIDLPPGTPLADPARESRFRPWVVLAGGVIGAALGAVCFAAAPALWASPASLAVIVLSTAVLGAWTAFLAGSFGSTAHHAWRHANREGKQIAD